MSAKDYCVARIMRHDSYGSVTIQALILDVEEGDHSYTADIESDDVSLLYLDDAVYLMTLEQMKPDSTRFFFQVVERCEWGAFLVAYERLADRFLQPKTPR